MKIEEPKRKLRSKQGYLFLLQTLPKVPTITVEDLSKWYDLHIVYPDGRVVPLFFMELEEAYELPGSAFCDHVPNPMAVCLYAAKHGFEVCSRSLAAITRRWFNEYYNTPYELSNRENPHES